jgi:hypothetical protein
VAEQAQCHCGEADFHRRLRLAWASTIEAGSLEPGPLVFNGVMYLPHPDVKTPTGSTVRIVFAKDE